MAIRWEDLKHRSSPERGEDRARAQAAPRRKRATSGKTAAQRRERSGALEEKYPRWETVVARVIPAKRRAEIKRRVRAEVAARRRMTAKKALRIVESLALEHGEERLTTEERAALGFVLSLIHEGTSPPPATPKRTRAKARVTRGSVLE